MHLALLARRRRLAGAVTLLLALPLAGALANCGGGDGEAASPNPPSVASSAPAAPAASTDTAAPDESTDKSPMPGARSDAWGAAPSSALTRNPAAWLPAMADAGITSVRNFHSAPGDDQLTPITAAGMSVVGILQWNSGPVWTLPVNDLAGWRNYVTEQVRRYQGRVKHWEVWNEPPNFTADQSPASYAKVVAVAFEAAKAVDPDVQIGLSAKSNHLNFLAEAIAAGAADRFDFVTLHPYEVAGLLPLGWEGQFMAIVPRLRAMLQVANPARAGVPVWFTEIGISAAPPAAGGVGPLGQADVLAKIYTMAFAQAVARVYWFDPSDSEGLAMGLTTADGARRPAWYALRSLNTQLGARPRYVGWTQPDGATYGFVFRGPQGVVLSAWSRPGQSAALALASEVTLVDPRTGASTTTRAPAVTEAPVLLVAPVGSPQARQWTSAAAANRGKPFPWNGDHSAATLLRLTAGAAPDGIFMVNPPATSVVNNLAEFNLQGGIGACFAADPTFLSYAYATSPIRISATVRGHGSGEPGFYLVYESGAPIAATDTNNLKTSASGWFRIRGTDFYEKHWRLPDARFIGLYGYNFCFYAPGPDHAGFSLRQVTLSR